MQGSLRSYRRSILSLAALTLMLAPTLHAAAHEQVLYRFRGKTDGRFPSSTLILDSSGNLYGTAGGGNTKNCVEGCGLVFELAFSGGKWQERVLYRFKGRKDGLDPRGNVVFDAKGNLYGTTYGGGSTTSCTAVPGCGTVFELSPNGDGSWTETVIYKFQDSSDGALPVGLTIDASGNLYGTTIAGGSGTRGTVFALHRKGGAWKEATLFAFPDFEIEANPGLVFDAMGNLYGTWFQSYSCYPGCGSVFELTPSGKDWQENTLFNFVGGGNGGEPMDGVILDSNGNIYGTGAEGGNNWGIAFELSLTDGQWTETIVHNFCDRNYCADGASPQSSLLFDPAGNLYGTAEGGGTHCHPTCGLVFKLSPVRFGWHETVLHDFKGEPDGSSPTLGLTMDRGGNLYGTTPIGGTGPNSGYGTVFAITP